MVVVMVNGLPLKGPVVAAVGRCWVGDLGSIVDGSLDDLCMHQVLAVVYCSHGLWVTAARSRPTHAAEEAGWHETARRGKQRLAQPWARRPAVASIAVPL